MLLRLSTTSTKMKETKKHEINQNVNEEGEEKNEKNETKLINSDGTIYMVTSELQNLFRHYYGSEKCEKIMEELHETSKAKTEKRYKDTDYIQIKKSLKNFT